MALNYELLKRLCETPGVPGREDQVRALVRAELGPLVDELSTDALGSVVGLKRGRGERRVMLAGHMDEIGFMVRYVDDEGFVRLQPLGGFDPRVLVAQRVVVHSASGEALRGVLSVAGKPIHLLDRDEIKVPKLDDFFVDLGLPASRVKEVVDLGDMVTLDRTVERVGDRIVGKAMDDRIGVFVMIEALRRVRAHEVDVLAVATAQEEVGLRGATTSAFHLAPHVGIALDVTLSVDTPGTGKHESVSRLGEGVTIGLMNSSVISNPRLVRHLRDIAVREQIPHQLEILPRGGTDAGAIQRSRGGLPTVTISVPTRYVHSVNEMVDPGDVEAAINLVARYIEAAHAGSYEL